MVWEGKSEKKGKRGKGKGERGKVKGETRRRRIAYMYTR